MNTTARSNLNVMMMMIATTISLLKEVRIIEDNNTKAKEDTIKRKQEDTKGYRSLYVTLVKSYFIHSCD